jgi:cysteinyl-tRNA synthetase
VDDKIILRGRQQYLLANFKSEHKSLDENLRSTTITAFAAYLTKNLPLIQTATPADFSASSKAAYQHVLDGKALEGDGPATDKEAKIKMHVRTATSASTALLDTTLSLEDFYLKADEVLLPYLDSLYGSTIDASDHSVFTTLTQKYEQRFFKDMDDLNNLRPNVVVRVTEYGPQIVEV